jgi:C4-dicarboxylate transporter, DctM subunit
VYGLLVGVLVHRTMRLADVLMSLREAAQLSAIIMIVMGLAGIFAYSVSTLGLVDPMVGWVKSLGWGSAGTLVALMLILLVVGMFLDGVSIFLIFLPLLYPLMLAFNWSPVWFGVLLTMMVAIGQFTPPMAVNLLVACKMAKVQIETTVPYVMWLVFSFLLATAAVAIWPQLALWLPNYLGY